MSRTLKVFAAIAAVLALASCAATPQASAERDAEAKKFYVHPSASTIYIYRGFFNRDEDSTLYMDGRVVGSTLPGTFFRIDTVPGTHVLHGVGLDAGYFSIETRPGVIYYVRLDVIAGHSRFRMEAESVARNEIQHSAMLESWAPGQRPFLR